MSIDLKPLSDEVIHKMGYGPHDLWIVKHEEEVFGPFEVESLKHYAIENEQLMQHSFASRMDTNDWQPFFSHAHFQPISDHAKVEEKYWIMIKGQKAGPLSRLDIDKKMELEILSLSDHVSVDGGETWQKFFNLESFVPQNAVVGAPPMAPLESSFIRAKEDLNDWMDNHERTGSHLGLAALTYLDQHRNKGGLNLEEMDLKSLAETEVSRSLRWAIPSAFAGVGVLVMVGNFILSPSMSTDIGSAKEEKSESIGPTKTHTARNPSHMNRRRPASYRPAENQRSALTQAPPMNPNEYPTHVETHYNEPDPMIDPVSEAENNPGPEAQEHSLVNNNVPGNETLDQVMAGGEQDPPPEQPVIEEASDF